MLASTIHISTNNQPHPPRKHQPRLHLAVCLPEHDRTEKTSSACSLRYPTGCLTPEPAAPSHIPLPNQSPGCTRDQAVAGRTSPVSPPYEPRHQSLAGSRVLPGFHREVLLRKEVIQPHLPVRLPCYDFVPIASPTFDHSLPTRGLGHGLRVLPTFVT